jgi:YggT family protein
MGANAATLSLLYDTVSHVQTFVGVFIYVYMLLLFAYLLLSWVKLPYSPTVNRLQRFLFDVCEPYLRLFRRVIPPVGGLDLSPILAFAVLYLVNRVAFTLLDQLH